MAKKLLAQRSWLFLFCFSVN